MSQIATERMCPACGEYPDLRKLLGAAVIDWLNYAREQHGRARGWHDGVEIVSGEFATDPWVRTPLPCDMPGVDRCRMDARWDYDPEAFLDGILAKLRAKRDLWAAAGRGGFHDPGGALDCCITAVTRVKQDVCRHQWGKVRSRPYSYDEPPEPDFRRCEKCGAEQDVEDNA